MLNVMIIREISASLRVLKYFYQEKLEETLSTMKKTASYILFTLLCKLTGKYHCNKKVITRFN